MKMRTLNYGRISLTMLATFVLAGSLILSWYKDSRDKAIATVESLASASAENIGRHLADTELLLGLIARLPPVRALNPIACDEGMRLVLDSDESHASVSLLDANGAIVCSIRRHPASSITNFADREWFRRTLAQNKFTIGSPFVGSQTGQWLSVMAYPIRDESGKAIGMVELSHELSNTHLEHEILPANTAIAVINGDGIIVGYHPDPARTGRSIVDHPVLSDTLSPESRTGVGTASDGTSVVFGRSTVHGFDWAVIALQPTDVVLAATRIQGVQTALLALLIIAATVVAVLIMDRRVNHDIRQVVETARAVADGNPDARMVVPRLDEFATISRQLNRMLDVRAAADQRIAKLNGLYAALSDVSQAITKAADRQGMIESVCRILSERCGFAVVWIGFIDPDTKGLAPSACHGGSSDYIDGFSTSVDRFNSRGNGPIGLAIRENRPQVIANLSQDRRTTHWCKSAAAFDLHSVAVFPFVENGSPCGVITLYSRETNYFDDAELMSVISETASALSFALDALHTDEARRDSEERFRQVAENIGEVFWLIDAASRNILYVSAAYEQIWGRPVEDVYRSPDIWVEAIHSDDRDRVLEAAQANEIGGTYDEQYRVVRPDGSIRWIHDRAFPIRNAAGEVYRVAGLAADVTDAKYMEDALRRSEATLLSAQELAGMGSWQRDFATNEGQWSATMFRLTNRDPALGIPDVEEFLELIDPADRKKVVECQQEALLTGRDAVVDFRTNAAFGPIRHLRTTASRGKADQGESRILRGSTLDITKIKDTEARLFQAQKMEALGNLAGGIAHDFNNMLLPILNLTELSRDDLPADHPVQDNLALVTEAATRASHLVKQILTFGRRSERRLQVLDIATCLKDAVRLLRNALPSTIALTSQIDPDTGEVEADPAELHSIILNMGTNSAHAMEGNGKLTLTVARARLSREQLLNRPQFAADQCFARIVIADTGHGMDAETIAKIFNPFFTTKPVGEGTGLGLAMVHGIVESLGGMIEVSSVVGSGTAFAIYLPLSPAQAASISPNELSTVCG